MSQNVSKEIEDEANSYFQRIYNHPPHPTLSIDEVLEMLSKFKESTSKRERVRGHLYSDVGILLNSISDKLIPNLINSDAEYGFLQNRFLILILIPNSPCRADCKPRNCVPGKSQLRIFQLFCTYFFQLFVEIKICHK